MRIIHYSASCATIETIFRTKEESRNYGHSYNFRMLVEDAVEWDQLTDSTFKSHKSTQKNT